MSVEVMGLLREIRENLDQADERIKGRLSKSKIPSTICLRGLAVRASRPPIIKPTSPKASSTVARDGR
jgi:hypothetical protein